jgi:hypothetical protein
MKYKETAVKEMVSTILEGLVNLDSIYKDKIEFKILLNSEEQELLGLKSLHVKNNYELNLLKQSIVEFVKKQEVELLSGTDDKNEFLTILDRFDAMVFLIARISIDELNS